MAYWLAFQNWKVMPIVLSLHYFLTNACYRNDNHLIKTCSYNSCLIFDIFYLQQFSLRVMFLCLCFLLCTLMSLLYHLKIARNLFRNWGNPAMAQPGENTVNSSIEQENEITLNVNYIYTQDRNLSVWFSYFKQEQ